MVEIGPLNKTQPTTQFWMYTDILQQDPPNNRTLIRGRLRNVQTGNGPGANPSQFLNTGIQQGFFAGWNFGNHGWVAPFLPPAPTGSFRWDDVFDFWITHAADGNYNSGQPVALSMHVAYGNIDEWHGATITIPRIPKPPGAPTPLGIDQITSRGFRYRFAGTTDGGSPITGWQVQYSLHSQFLDGGVIVASSGTNVFADLLPGSDYYVRSRGLNAAGAGPWSATLPARTLSGAYVGKGNTFLAAEVFVGRGGVFVPAAEVRVGKGGSFIISG